MPIVLKEMEKVGVADDIMKTGHANREGIRFIRSHAKGGEVLGSLKMSQIPKGSVTYDFAGIHLGQHAVAKILLEHCQRQPSFNILWKHRYAGAKQINQDQPIEVAATGPVGETFFTCDYLIGCDGAGSAVRRSQCIPFEGFTWNDFRFVASNVKYDFEEHGFSTANMVVDEEDWAVIARTGPGDEPWRVAFGVRTDVPRVRNSQATAGEIRASAPWSPALEVRSCERQSLLGPPKMRKDLQGREDSSLR